MRDSWRQNFQPKYGRQVSSIGCSRCSETRAQWTDVRQQQTAKCSHGWKHWPGERYGSESKGPARTHSTVCEISRKTGIPISHLLSASYDRICSWNALRGDVRKSWLWWTVLLVSCFWGSFRSLPRTWSSSQMKRYLLWLQYWKTYCENQLRLHRVKANKIKRVLRARYNFHQIWTSNFPR